MTDLHGIIEGCKRNDRSSQEKLYRQFYPGLFALCKTFFPDNHDALTSLNNGMLNVFKNIGKYDPARGNLFNWAYTIVRNAAITHLNSLKVFQPTTEITVQMEQSTFYSPFKQLEWNDIYIYLDKLPPATRAVCTLHYLEGFAIKEISEQLNLSQGTIKWHLNCSMPGCRFHLPILLQHPSPHYQEEAGFWVASANTGVLPWLYWALQAQLHGGS
jgi:RNA polymerase sigma factor (sigma-70 family)